MPPYTFSVITGDGLFAPAQRNVYRLVLYILHAVESVCITYRSVARRTIMCQLWKPSANTHDDVVSSSSSADLTWRIADMPLGKTTEMLMTQQWPLYFPVAGNHDLDRESKVQTIEDHVQGLHMKDLRQGPSCAPSYTNYAVKLSSISTCLVVWYLRD